jgi:hypothetical protein
MVAVMDRSIEARKSSVEKAIKLLSKEYIERLTDDDFIGACEYLTNKEKASAFITLPSKRMRDLWLQSLAGVLILKDVDRLDLFAEPLDDL